MPDQRRVGHAIRRRMGAAPSHLGQAEEAGIWHPPGPGLSTAEGTAGQTTDISYAGGRYLGTKGHIKGVPDTYPTGTGSTGMGAGPPLGDNSSFVAGVSGGVDAEPHPARQRMESSGARLTVSPSMKVPQESPVPTQGGGAVVPSTPSRQGSFGQGQQEMYSG